MLLMSSEPPLVSGTTWSAYSTTPVEPQLKHLLPYLSQSSLNSGRETAAARVLCSPSHTAIVGFELSDLFEVVFGPFCAAGNYLFTILLVVGALVSRCAGAIGSCPRFLVFSDLFFVFFLILPTRLDPVRQIGPRPFVLGVLLPTVVTILSYAALDARLALPNCPSNLRAAA